MTETRLRFYLNNEMIYSFYLEEDIDLTRSYSAPWREDSSPSLSFKNYGTFSAPKIFWKDFGLECTVVQDGIGFVQQMFDLTRNQAVRKIWKDMIASDVKVSKPNVKKPINLPYEVKSQPLRDFELKYWSRLGIDRSILEFYNISSLKSMGRLGKSIWSSTEDNPTYIYQFEDAPGAFKAYRPLDKRGDKFRGQANGNIIEGYDQLPQTGRLLIINSSLKDTVVMRRAGYFGINPTSENSKRKLLTSVRELNSRFDRVIIFFDNDGPGIRSAKVLSETTGWGYTHLPLYMLQHGITDPSDLVSSCGNYYELLNFCKNVLN